MISLAGHGKDSRLVQPELPLEKKRAKASLPKGIKVGDMVTDLEDGTIGKVVSFCDRHINVKTADSIQSHNLEFGTPKLEIHTHPDQSVVFAIGDRVTLANKTFSPSEKFGMGATVISKNWDKKITCTRIKVEFDDGTIYPCIEGAGWFKKLDAEEKESCLHILTASEVLEPLAKLADVQEKSKPSPTSTSTKRRNKSTATTSQSLASIPTSEVTVHPEESISILGASHVQELASQENATDLTTQNQIFGTNTLELSTKANPTLCSSKTLQDCLMDNSISEWVKSCKTFPKSGIWESGKFCQQDTLDRPKLEKGCLSLPTLTTGIGSKRNAGATSCETWLKDKGFVQPTQALSIEMMCLLFGFPIAWAKSLSSAPRDRLGEQQPESFLVEQSISTVQSSQLSESCTSIAALTKVRINKTTLEVPSDIAPIFQMQHTVGINIVNPSLLDLVDSLSSDRLRCALDLSEKYGGCQKKRELLVRHLKTRDSLEKYKFYSREFPSGAEVEIAAHPKSTNVWAGSKGIVQSYKSDSEAAAISYKIVVKIYSQKHNTFVNPSFEDFELKKIDSISVNNIDARLQFLLEQRDRLIASGASPQGVWLSVGQVYKKDFRQVVWKSAHEHEWLSGNKSRYIGKENSDEHLSAIAQHAAGQQLRKIEREIKSIQKKLVES